MKPGSCLVCGGAEEPRKVQFFTLHQDQPILIEGVPALVCTQCGEETFDALTIKQLETLLAHPGSPSRTVETPVLSFSAAH